MREMKGPGQLYAQEEGAGAALCARGRSQGRHLREMKFFLPQLFYSNITFLTFLKKVRNVRNVMLRVAVVVKNNYISDKMKSRRRVTLDSVYTHPSGGGSKLSLARVFARTLHLKTQTCHETFQRFFPHP